MSRYNGIYEHFHSYGHGPNKTLESVSMKTSRNMNEATPYLTNQLNWNAISISIAKVKYQDCDGYVNTCGSHVVHKLYRLKNGGINLSTNYNYMKRIKDEFGVNYDIIDAEFVNKWF